MDLGKAIKIQILKADKTQQWLANELGVTRTWVSAITSNIVKPNLKTLEKMCALTDTKMSELFAVAEDLD